MVTTLPLATEITVTGRTLPSSVNTCVMPAFSPNIPTPAFMPAATCSAWRADAGRAAIGRAGAAAVNGAARAAKRAVDVVDEALIRNAILRGLTAICNWDPH
jgi:hypothetical protein